MNNKQYEDQKAFPLAHIECLLHDLELIMEKSKKRKNKDKIDVLANMAQEMTAMHLAELMVDLENTNTNKGLYTSKQYHEMLTSD